MSTKMLISRILMRANTRRKLNSILMRDFSKSAIKMHRHRPSVPGDNIPVPLDSGKYKLTLWFMFFFGIPLGAPWLVIWREMNR